MTSRNRPPPPDVADAVRALVQLARLDGQARERAVSPVAAERMALLARVPGDIVMLYERLASTGRHPIAPIIGNYCSGCHLRIPPQLAHAVANSWELARCPHCGRLLYDPRTHV